LSKERKVPQKEKIILGVDPGTNFLGYGVIKVVGKEMTLLDVGVLQINSKDDLGIKLKAIYFEIIRLVNSHHPDHLAIEAQFFGKNVQSMLKLGKAQGVTIAAALSRDIPFTEYAPKKIKQSITGNGNASKEQVAGMLKNILKMKTMPEKLDATDALATAVCHHYQENTLGGGEKYSGWDSFLKNNPQKIK
jgi:crossover junction endodeoxyribonuclease RuvC